jgi:hypothetical protein
VGFDPKESMMYATQWKWPYVTKCHLKGGKFVKMEPMSVEGMTNPVDLLLSSNGDLFIPNRSEDDNESNNCLLKVSAAGELLKRLPYTDEPESASLTRDGQIIVTMVKKTARMVKKTACILQPDLKSETYKLPTNIGDPQHIIEHPDRAEKDCYLVLHNRSIADNKKTSVGCIWQLKLEKPHLKFEKCIICANDPDENCIHQNCNVNYPYQDRGFLCDPRHMSRLDNDHIFVADFRNNRVVILNVRNGMLTELLTRDAESLDGMRVERPCRVAYYESDKLLFVAMHHEGVVYRIEKQCSISICGYPLVC